MSAWQIIFIIVWILVMGLSLWKLVEDRLEKEQQTNAGV